MERVIIFLIRCLGQGLGHLYLLQPRRLQVFWGSLLGLMICFFKVRYEVVQKNLAIAYPGETAQQSRLRDKVLKDSYRHLGNLILEAFLVLGPIRLFVSRYVDLRGTEHIKSAEKQQRGVIFLSSHLGNWEVMAATAGVLAKTDLMLVTKKIKPSVIHQAIESGRKSCGVKATYEPRTLKDILKQLKGNRAIGFVMDQYAGPPVGVRVPVFGVPVGTPMAIATLAKRTGALVLPVENYREKNGRWTIIIHPALEWQTFENPHHELAANTASYASVIEGHIYAHPEQWLWIHRRFKGDMSPLRPGEWDEPRARR